MKLREKKFEVEEKLSKLSSKIEIMDGFIKYLKPHDIIHIPELSYDPFCDGYHPLEVQSTSDEYGSVYTIEKSIMKEHYFYDLDFYVRDEKGDFIYVNEIKDVGMIKKICKINRKFKKLDQK